MVLSTQRKEMGVRSFLPCRWWFPSVFYQLQSTDRQSFEIGLISVAKFVAPAAVEHDTVRENQNESKVSSKRVHRVPRQE